MDMNLNMMQTSDRDIWVWAKQNNSIIITKDEYFVILHSADAPPCAMLGKNRQHST